MVEASKLFFFFFRRVQERFDQGSFKANWDRAGGQGAIYNRLMKGPTGSIVSLSSLVGTTSKGQADDFLWLIISLRAERDIDVKKMKDKTPNDLWVKGSGTGRFWGQLLSVWDQIFSGIIFNCWQR